ncbi:MAG TPA: TraR/DksA family transcriptional regulator [Pirellulaceae bacterium]|nr:TraR/DksA family transcriptional regulator [Pirellulaceae bacterium]
MKRTDMLKQTQKQLVARRDALRRSLEGDRRMLQSLSESGVGDEIDAAIATEQAEMDSQMASFESRELARIEHALEQIREGRYGRCEVCEKAIAPVRLKALPYATECIQCASKGERRGASASGFRPVNRIAAFATDDDREPSIDDLELEESR